MAEIIGKTNEGIYLGKPLRTFEGTVSLPMNDPNFQNGTLLGQEALLPVELAIHPNLSRRIIVNVPGYNGEIDGYADKYKRLAHEMQSQNLGAVVRTGNPIHEGYLVDTNLRAALLYARKHAWEICGNESPEILLIGTSAGGSAVASIAHEYPEVTKMLLIAPSGDMPIELLRKGLNQFTGEVYIVIGEQDRVVKPTAGKYFYDLAIEASHKELFTLPNCDHNFTGETNSRILSEAPFYAFTNGEKPLFPDPIGGIKLYN